MIRGVAAVVAALLVWSPHDQLRGRLRGQRSSGSQQSSTLCSDAETGGTARYLYSGAGGSGTGANWTNAWTTLSAAESGVSRGQTVCVADGSYGSATLNVATSGTSTITFVKATVADHGTSTGWSDTMGDGQATFGDISVFTDYVVISGATRDENDWSDGTAYGFKASGISSIDDQASLVCADNLTVEYVNLGSVTGTTASDAEGIDNVLKGTGYSSPCENWTVSRNFLHNITHFCLFCANGFAGATIEYNRFQDAWGKEAIRGQISFGTGIIRWNQFVNACGFVSPDGCTAEIAIWDDCASGSCDGNEIYGNYFYRTNGDENSGGTIVVGGNGSTWAGSSASDTLVYNNTIAGISGATNTGGDILVNGGTGNICRNNLGYDIAGTFDVSCSTTSNNSEVTSDPFVAYASGDLHLSGATTAGTSLGSPYNADLDGVTRGGDGTWDLGAYEFVAPAPLPNMATTMWRWLVSHASASRYAASQSRAVRGWSVSVNPTPRTSPEASIQYSTPETVTTRPPASARIRMSQDSSTDPIGRGSEGKA